MNLTIQCVIKSLTAKGTCISLHALNTPGLKYLYHNIKNPSFAIQIAY